MKTNRRSFFYAFTAAIASLFAIAKGRRTFKKTPTFEEVMRMRFPYPGPEISSKEFRRELLRIRTEERIALAAYRH